MRNTRIKSNIAAITTLNCTVTQNNQSLLGTILCITAKYYIVLVCNVISLKIHSGKYVIFREFQFSQLYKSTMMETWLNAEVAGKYQCLMTDVYSTREQPIV